MRRYEHNSADRASGYIAVARQASAAAAGGRGRQRIDIDALGLTSDMQAIPSPSARLESRGRLADYSSNVTTTPFRTLRARRAASQFARRTQPCELVIPIWSGRGVP